MLLCTVGAVLPSSPQEVVTAHTERVSMARALYAKGVTSSLAPLACRQAVQCPVCGLFINDKHCESIQVLIGEGDGRLSESNGFGFGESIKATPSFSSPQGDSQEVQVLSWCPQRWSDPGWGCRSSDWLPDCPRLPFLPRPQSGAGRGHRPCTLVSGRSFYTVRLFPSALDPGGHAVLVQSLAPPGMEPWAVHICKPLLPSLPPLQDTGTIQWLPLPLSPEGQMAG